ncbi:MAG: homoserine kinase [Oscillospiraceae bacterium]|nr:homoserine kinase [Oscillospiraceae bacterium]
MKIRVPASSANLGPGFDCFGIAWQLYNELEFELCEEGLHITGCDDRFLNEDNLAYAAYRLVLERCGVEPAGLRINFASTRIPISRGLGASSALLAAGVIAANELHGLKLSKKELLEMAATLEGHPDNVVPAFCGGLSASAMVAGKPVTVPYPVSDKLYFTALIPPFELSTEEARRVLPQYVPREDAVFNVSRAALLLNALGSGDTELLRLAMDDRLHQPYRIPLVRGYDIARGLAYKCGAAALCISGAGPTILCVSDSPDFVERMTEASAFPLPGLRILPLEVDNIGAKIIE